MEQVLYKKKYTVREFYTILYKGIRTFTYFKKHKKNEQLSYSFTKRIMLAVTEVNGCEVCSYAHTKDALEQGMDEKEINQLLVGVTDETPTNELKAILFAQHYADTKGNPTQESWEEIIDTYGEDLALGILGAIRMIMVGNSYGIALSAFKSRVKGKAVKQSSLLYEIRMLLSIIPLLPATIIHSFIAKVFNVPMISFSDESIVQDTSTQSKK